MGHRSKTFPSVLVAALFLAALFTECFTVTAQTTPAWNTQLVDRYGDGNSIAIDSRGNPHIAYSSYYIPNSQNPSSATGLNYAVWTGTNWTIQTVDVSASSGFLALDSMNCPHIIYPKNNSLNYAVLNGASWDMQRIDSTIDPLLLGTYSMVLDSNGIPHIVYFTFDYKGNITSNNGYLKYAVLEGSKWKIQTIDTLNATSAYVRPSIALDSNNHLHVIYVETVQIVDSGLIYDVKYATLTGSNWSIQTALKRVSEVGNLVVDSSGKPSFCYVSFGTTEALKYAHWNGNAWLSKDVTSAQFVERQSHFYLNIDSNSNPQVLFYAKNFQNEKLSGLLYLQWTGSSWNTQNLGVIPLNDSPIFQGAEHIDNLVFGNQGEIGLTYTGELGTVSGAPVYGGLTYATIQYTNAAQSSLVTLTTIIVVIVVLVVVILPLLLYRRHRKTTNLTQ